MSLAGDFRETASRVEVLANGIERHVGAPAGSGERIVHLLEVVGPAVLRRHHAMVLVRRDIACIGSQDRYET